MMEMKIQGITMPSGSLMKTFSFAGYAIDDLPPSLGATIAGTKKINFDINKIDSVVESSAIDARLHVMKYHPIVSFKIRSMAVMMAYPNLDFTGFAILAYHCFQP